MSFVQKVKENKQNIIAVVGGLAVGYILFKLIEGRKKQQTAAERRKRQIQYMRRQINPQNPSFQDIKRVMQYAIHEAKIKVAAFSRVFKEKRMKFTRHNRKQNIKDYLNLVSDGMEQMQMIAIREQHDLMKQLGISEIHFRKYQRLLQKAMQQIMTIQSKDISHIKPMKLEEIKFAIRQQIQFVKSQGTQYAQLIIGATKDWSKQKKASLPLLLSMVITDCAFEKYPLIDPDSVEHAESQYQKELMGELQQLQVAIAPMMIKLNNSMKQVSGFDISDLREDYNRMDYQQANKLRQYEKKRSGNDPLFNF